MTAALDALCDAIGRTTPAEVVAGLDPAALIKLARDAEVASAWLAALQVLAHQQPGGAAPIRARRLSLRTRRRLPNEAAS